jgi:hypothetical protein
MVNAVQLNAQINFVSQMLFIAVTRHCDVGIRLTHYDMRNSCIQGRVLGTNILTVRSAIHTEGNQPT